MSFQKRFFSLLQAAAQNTLWIVGVDAIAIVLAVVLAFWLRFDGSIPSSYLQGSLQGVVGLILASTLSSFWILRLYSFSFKHVGITDILSVARALVASALLVGGLFLIFPLSFPFGGFPRSVLLMSYVFIFFFASGIRLAKRIWGTYKQSMGNHEGGRMLIVGAGDAGVELLRNALLSKEYVPVGFVDDDVIKHGVSIQGVRVLGSLEDIPSLAAVHKVEHMFIALPSAAPDSVKLAFEKGRNAGIPNIKIVPSLVALLQGEASLQQLREVQVEDLLGREVLSLDRDLISQFLAGKIVLITGAAGSIGSELARQALQFGPKTLLLLDQDESGLFLLADELKRQSFSAELVPVVADIKNTERMNAVFKEQQPHVVFHAAAYKHVPLMETYPQEAVRTNVLGTEVVAKAALKAEVKTFVNISCLDEKTRILTNEGLKRWDEVKSGMKTLSLSKKGEIEENEIEKVVSQKYSGPMVQIRTRSIDMLVTPNHKMVVQLPQNSASIIEEEAQKTAERSVVYIPKGIWNGIDEEWISLPTPETDIHHPLRNCPTRVRTSDMLYLLGIFIGDGFLNSGYKRQDGRKTDKYGAIFLDIPEKDKARQRILDTLDRMGVTYKCYKGKAGEHIYFSSRVLAQVFGSCGRGAKNKTIPNWALQYSPRILQSLLDGLVDSDGHRPGRQQRLTSISPSLMEKSAELAAKLNLHFTVSIQQNKEITIEGRKVSPSQSFIGLFSNTRHRSFGRKHCKRVPYRGVIWCVRVKNNHNFLAERNGKFFFTGNTDKAVNPTSVMGATKRLGEMICQNFNQKNHTRFVSVRFGNVLDSRGSVIPLFRSQLKRGTIEVTHPDMQRYFMLTPEACLLVMQAGAIGSGGEVFVLDMGKPVKIVDLAHMMIQLSGSQNVEVKFSGMRPGEKLFEEILSAEEGTSATQHQKIFAARLPLVKEDTLLEGLEKMRKACQEGRGEEIRLLLRELVPSYTPWTT